MTSQTLPPTMRAWTYNSRGSPRAVLTLNPAFPTPPPPSGSNLLIHVSHAALNPLTRLLMSIGIPPLFRRGSIPASIPEADFAGTVQLAGPGAPEKFKPGTRVFGSIAPVSWEVLRSGAGTLAEYVVVSVDAAAVIPDGMGMKEASGLSLCGQTALMMCQAAGIKPGLGQRVLINGASGGVGTMACQIAKAMGASEVVATCSGGKVEMVKGLGADKVVDYRAVAPLPAHLAATYGDRPFDVILDLIGTQPLYEQCPKYLKSDGPYFNIGSHAGLLWLIWCTAKNTVWPVFLGGTPRKYTMLSLTPTASLAEKLAEMVAAGKLRVVVDSVFEMKDVLPAFDRMMTKTARGKIVVKIQDD